MSAAGNRDPIAPHGGGELVDLTAPAAERAALKAAAAKLPAIVLNARDLADLEMLATGAFTPLTGFMNEADYASSRDRMRLASGVPWSVPITLGIAEEALAAPDGERIAILKLGDIFRVDRRREAEAVFGTADEAHPGAKNVLDAPATCVAGRPLLFGEIPGRTFLEYPREPRATRAAFRELGWRKIVAF